MEILRWLKIFFLKKVHKKARSCERCHSSNVSKRLFTWAKGTFKKRCSLIFSEQSQNVIPAEAWTHHLRKFLWSYELRNQAAKLGGSISISHSLGPFFTHPQKPLFSDHRFLLGFIFVENIHSGTLISCQFSRADGKIFYLSSYVWIAFFIFLKGKRTALLFCWTTYSLIYNAGQQGLVSVYSGSSEDTWLSTLKLDSSYVWLVKTAGKHYSAPIARPVLLDSTTLV